MIVERSASAHGDTVRSLAHQPTLGQMATLLDEPAEGAR
jgi:hypothetical protein